MTEQQAIEALHALPRLPRSGASLERMQALLDHLGNPEKQFKCIHIAGTNGKGTLAAMTSSILTHAGYKTGLTISPYVLNFRERFQINGQMMSPRTLASLTRKVLDAADAIIAEGGEGPVEFEAVTAIAFLWFARQKCDFAVVETGLGGRYDATNVIPAPLVAAITRIGMDHTEIWAIPLPRSPPKSRYHQRGQRGCLLPRAAGGGHGPAADRRGQRAYLAGGAGYRRFAAAQVPPAGKLC